MIQDLKQEGIAHGSSKKDMIPGYYKAFVFVSGGICPFEEKEMEDFYLSKSQGWSVLPATEPELKSKSEARSVMIFKLFLLSKFPV